jgi:lipoyl(octanoyl) transferase
MNIKKIKLNDLGEVEYLFGISTQKDIHNLSTSQANILFLEHNKVITIGRRGSKDDILFSNEEIKKRGFEIIRSDRGGQVTIHNRGQLVCYLIIPIKKFNIKPVDLVRKIENLIINFLKKYNISASAIKNKTGVWINQDNSEKKIAAIGVRISNGVSMHGFALNVNNDLKDFDLIIPCGLEGSMVTSMSNELSVNLNKNEIKKKLIKEIENIFDCEVINE